MKNYIIGAGALGRELHEYLCMDDPTTEWLFADDSSDEGPASDSLAPADYGIVAVANPYQRRQLFLRLKCRIGAFIHSTSIGGFTRHFQGLLRLPFTLVSADARAGEGLLMNAYSSVGHDCRIGDFCTLSAYVGLAGNVTVGDEVFFGIGAKVLPGVTIGDGAFIGAGSVVTKDVEPRAKVFGNPARVI